MYLPSFIVCDDLFTDWMSAFACGDTRCTAVTLAFASTKVFGSTAKAKPGDKVSKSFMDAYVF